MASEQYPSDLTGGEPEEKPSGFIGKLKAKAGKYKSKLHSKIGGSDNNDQGDVNSSEDPGEDEEDTEEDVNQGNQQVPHTPLSNQIPPQRSAPEGPTSTDDSPSGAVGYGQSAYGSDQGQSEGGPTDPAATPSNPTDPASVYKSDAPAETDEADPTSYESGQPRDYDGSESQGGINATDQTASDTSAQPVEQDQGVGLGDSSQYKDGGLVGGAAATAGGLGSSVGNKFQGSNDGGDQSGVGGDTQDGLNTDSPDAADPGAEQKPITTRLAEGAYGYKDYAVNHPVTQTALSKLGYANQALSPDGTPISQKAADSASNLSSQAQDTVNNLSSPTTDDGQPKPLTDRLTEAAGGIKDNVANHPYTQQAVNYGNQGKDSAAGALTSADQQLSSDDKPVSQKAWERTQPADHDKALAGSVTESIKNLPGLLTGKLGFGPSSPTTPGAQAQQAGSDSSEIRQDTPHPDSSNQSAPGIFDRVSGIASSLFGGAAKQTGTDQSTPPTEQQ